MALTNPELIRIEGNLPDDFDEGKINHFIKRASLEVRGSVGDDKYATYEDSLKSESPTKEAQEVQQAETFLALSYLIIPLHIKTLNDGGIVRSVGFDDGRTNLIDYDEAQKLSENYYKKYTAIINKYVPIVDEDEDGSPDYIDNKDISFYDI